MSEIYTGQAPATINAIQHEQWFEVTRRRDSITTDTYILLVSSYGKLRKVFETGGYRDVHDGGPV